MHRLLVFLSFALLFSPTHVIGQEQEEEPLPPRHASAKLGGAGGFTPYFLFLNVDPINDLLKNSNAGTFSNGTLPMYGGQGYAYIMLLRNVRIGGMGASGTMTSSLPSGNTVRTVDLSAGFGGVTIDYVLPLTSRLDLTMGMVLGGGSMTFKITRDDGTPKVWNNLWNSYGTNADSIYAYSQKLSGSFFVYQPNVNLEYTLLRWIGLRVGVSYMGTAGGSWRLDDNYDIYGVPDNINSKGWMINTGIFLGTFGF